jgi:hypothetical protein
MTEITLEKVKKWLKPSFKKEMMLLIPTVVAIVLLFVLGIIIMILFQVYYHQHTYVNMSLARSGWGLIWLSFVISLVFLGWCFIMLIYSISFFWTAKQLNFSIVSVILFAFKFLFALGIFINITFQGSIAASVFQFLFYIFEIVLIVIYVVVLIIFRRKIRRTIPNNNENPKKEEPTNTKKATTKVETTTTPSSSKKAAPATKATTK